MVFQNYLSLFKCSKLSRALSQNKVLKNGAISPKFKRNYSIPHQLRELPFYFYIIPVITTCLGIWQVKRHFWKQELKRKANEERLRIEELELPPLEECTKFYNKRFKLKGKFLHKKEFLVGPCNSYYCNHPVSGIKCKDGTVANRTFHIYTPFVVADTGKSILVDRGYFAEKARLNPALRTETIKENKVDEITGYLVNMWKFYDVYDVNMWETVDYDVHILRADKTQSFEDGPIGQDQMVEMYDMHYQYAFFWFMMTFIFFALAKRTKSGKFTL